MRRLLMLEEYKTWKREFGFDYIEIAAEMDARCSKSRFFFYRNMFNPKRQHTLNEFTLEMKVDVVLLKMDITLSQPAPQSQCDPSPRSAAVDTGSEEPGTPPRSPAIGTRSDGSGLSRIELSMEEEGLLPLETSNFASPEQEYILLQPGVGVDDNDEVKTLKTQAGAREEFARLPIGQQQRETASTEQSKQFDRGRSE